MRQSGDIERARHLADRMVALADQLVGAYPRDADAHVARGMAYAQVYKNAYKTDDEQAIDRNMRLAYESAVQAQLYDPASIEARHQVDDLQRRLAARPRRGRRAEWLSGGVARNFLWRREDRS
jgi:hypothetical protein